MRLREIREARGLSQYGAAKELGIDRAQMHRWESGKVAPSIEGLVKLADFYGVTVDQLLGRAPLPNHDPAA